LITINKIYDISRYDNVIILNIGVTEYYYFDDVPHSISLGFTYPELQLVGTAFCVNEICIKRNIKPITVKPANILRNIINNKSELVKFNLSEKSIVLSDEIPRIGFNNKQQRWYGWKYNICKNKLNIIFRSFGIGEIITKGDEIYIPSNEDELIEKFVNSNSDIQKITKILYNMPDPLCRYIGIGVIIYYINKFNLQCTEWLPYPDEWGRNPWIARTLDDAKKMAIEFAGCSHSYF